LDQEKADIEKQLEEAKSELGEWMYQSEAPQLVLPEKLSVNIKQKKVPKRLYAADILQIVERLKGSEILDRVIDELDKIHTERW
jgi:hypothetical protein